MRYKQAANRKILKITWVYTVWLAEQQLVWLSYNMFLSSLNE
jgi:hypothetical protein